MLLSSVKHVKQQQSLKKKKEVWLFCFLLLSSVKDNYRHLVHEQQNYSLIIGVRAKE